MYTPVTTKVKRIINFGQACITVPVCGGAQVTMRAWRAAARSREYYSALTFRWNRRRSFLRHGGQVAGVNDAYLSDQCPQPRVVPARRATGQVPPSMMISGTLLILAATIATSLIALFGSQRL